MSCCCKGTVKRTIIANSAVATPGEATVTLTIDGIIPQQCDFELCIPCGMLVNAGTGVVSITDGTTTLPLLDRCGDTVRYDSLIWWCRSCCCAKKLCASARSGERIILGVNLPESSYLAPAAPAPTPAA